MKNREKKRGNLFEKSFVVAIDPQNKVIDDDEIDDSRCLLL